MLDRDLVCVSMEDQFDEAAVGELVVFYCYEEVREQRIMVCKGFMALCFDLFTVNGDGYGAGGRGDGVRFLMSLRLWLLRIRVGMGTVAMYEFAERVCGGLHLSAGLILLTGLFVARFSESRQRSLDCVSSQATTRSAGRLTLGKRAIRKITAWFARGLANQRAE